MADLHIVIHHLAVTNLVEFHVSIIDYPFINQCVRYTMSCYVVFYYGRRPFTCLGMNAMNKLVIFLVLF